MKCWAVTYFDHSGFVCGCFWFVFFLKNKQSKDLIPCPWSGRGGQTPEAPLKEQVLLQPMSQWLRISASWCWEMHEPQCVNLISCYLVEHPTHHPGDRVVTGLHLFQSSLREDGSSVGCYGGWGWSVLHSPLPSSLPGVVLPTCTIHPKCFVEWEWELGKEITLTLQLYQCYSDGKHFIWPLGISRCCWLLCFGIRCPFPFLLLLCQPREITHALHNNFSALNSLT